MNLREMPVSDLMNARAEYNPRHISKAARERLRASLDQFGLVQPLIFNERTGRLVSGHQRLDILAEQEIERVHVVIVDLDEPQEKALNIAMNRTDLAGDWDRSKLDSLLAELSAGSQDLLESLKLDEMPEVRASDLDSLVAKIESEKEWTPGPRDVDPALIAEAVAARIRSMAPADLGRAAVVSVSTGTRDVLILANDPSHEDLISEVRRAQEAGDPSPLERLFDAIV